MKNKIVGVFFLLSITLGISASENSSPDLNHPVFSKKEALLFSSGPDHAAVKIRTGDIALRLGTDTMIAVGTYPVPKSFYEDLKSKNGANWDIYKMVATTLKVPNASSKLGLGVMLEESYRFNVLTELRKSKEQSLPDSIKLNYKKTLQMRGKSKPFIYDDFPSDSPEGIAHSKIEGFQPNYYKIPMVQESDSALLDKVVHYYPGTPFVSHAGIFSVEEENGVEKIYIYDIVPGVGGDTPEDARFPSGLRKLTPYEFYNTKEARYGVIMRSNVTTSEQNINVLEAAWKHYHDAQLLDGETDLFDYTFDWRQNEKFACSSYVWRSFVEGAGINIASNLNIALAPAWVVKKISGYDLKMDLQISPQTLLATLFTDRVVDFEAAAFEGKLKAYDEGKGPQALPSRNERNSKTGHVLFTANDRLNNL